MNDNHRDQYLRQEWSAYPQAPMTTLSVARARLKSAGKEDFWLGGEVVEVSDTALKIAAQGETQAWKNLKVELASILRPGDKVAVRQSGGELRVILLAPALREQERSALKVGVARQWQEFLGKIRAHFQQEGYLEVQTPSLVPCPGFEPTLEPFFVELKKGRSLQKLFLPTSPELHLKRLLSQGWSEIFEIRSCFRNNEFSNLHQPEFTMLEWYRSYCGLAELGEDLRGLVEALAGPVRFKVVRVAELFEEILSFRLTPQTSGAELTELLKQKGASAPDGEVWNDLFHRLWVEFIDPRLGEVGEALLVSGYPPSQAALARIGADGWAERLEFYWRGLEIANGFHELNSPVEQRLRAEQDLRERQRLGGTQIPIDEKFLCSLEAGMAPGAGIAVGLERLFMAIYGVKDIRELKAFAL